MGASYLPPPVSIICRAARRPTYRLARLPMHFPCIPIIYHNTGSGCNILDLPVFDTRNVYLWDSLKITHLGIFCCGAELVLDHRYTNIILCNHDACCIHLVEFALFGKLQVILTSPAMCINPFDISYLQDKSPSPPLFLKCDDPGVMGRCTFLVQGLALHHRNGEGGKLIITRLCCPPQAWSPASSPWVPVILHPIPRQTLSSAP